MHSTVGRLAAVLFTDKAHVLAYYHVVMVQVSECCSKDNKPRQQAKTTKQRQAATLMQITRFGQQKTTRFVGADIGTALPKFGHMGIGHGGVERLHQLVCIIPHMVSTAQHCIALHCIALFGTCAHCMFCMLISSIMVFRMAVELCILCLQHSTQNINYIYFLISTCFASAGGSTTYHLTHTENLEDSPVWFWSIATLPWPLPDPWDPRCMWLGP